MRDLIGFFARAFAVVLAHGAGTAKDVLEGGYRGVRARL